MRRDGLGELALAALRASADGFAVYRVERGQDGEVTTFVVELVNDAFAGWAGRSTQECVGLDVTDLDPDARDNGRRALMVATLTDGEPRRLRTERPDLGVTLECLMTRHTRDGGERVVVTTRDVTELVAGERLLSAAYEMTAEVRATLQTALDATSDAFAVYDVERDGDGVIVGLRLVLINMAGALPLSDGGPDALVGQDLRDFYPAATETGLWDAVCTAMERQVTTQFRLMEQPPLCSHPDLPAPVEAWDNTIAPVGEERVVLTWRDVSGEVRRERELEQAHDDAHYAATHDPLTGLANRALLLDELTEALWTSGEDERVGVVFVDLDGFKGVNDRYGHAVGDELLQAVAARLLRIVREGDTVARVGGDEFVLVLRRLPRDWDDKGFIDRAQTAMEEQLMLATCCLQPRASYGLVVSPPASRDLDRLMKIADHEMYQHKQARKQGRSTDAGSTDAGSTDAGSTDAGSTDAGSTDAGSTTGGRTPSDTLDDDPAAGGSAEDNDSAEDEAALPA
jgi:diguanylate cyclase (GGDEF)-like protein